MGKAQDGREQVIGTHTPHPYARLPSDVAACCTCEQATCTETTTHFRSQTLTLGHAELELHTLFRDTAVRAGSTHPTSPHAVANSLIWTCNAPRPLQKWTLFAFACCSVASCNACTANAFRQKTGSRVHAIHTQMQSVRCRHMQWALPLLLPCKGTSSRAAMSGIAQ